MGGGGSTFLGSIASLIGLKCLTGAISAAAYLRRRGIRITSLIIVRASTIATASLRTSATVPSVWFSVGYSVAIRGTIVAVLAIFAH